MYKIQPIRVAYKKPINLNFCAIFKIILQKGKPVFGFSVLYPRKSGLSEKLKVSTVDIQIKRPGLRISNSKDFSSGCKHKD